MKTWKRLLSVLLAVSVIVLYMGQSAEAYVLDVDGSNSDITETKYNVPYQPQNVSVEEKEIAGNTKHFITWKNDSQLLEDYPENPNTLNEWDTSFYVEVYCVPYLKYLNSGNWNIPVEEVDETMLKDIALPAVHCANVTASDCGTVINFTDVWQSLESIPEGDARQWVTRMAASSLVDTITSIIKDMDDSNLVDMTNNIFAKFRYCMSNGDTANYIKYSRVKYYVRYRGTVLETLEEFMDMDEDGNYHYYLNTLLEGNYTGKKEENGSYSVVTEIIPFHYEVVTKERLYFMNEEGGVIFRLHDYQSSSADGKNTIIGEGRYRHNTGSNLYYGNPGGTYQDFVEKRNAIHPANPQFLEPSARSYIRVNDEETISGSPPVNLSSYVDTNIPIIADRGASLYFETVEEYLSGEKDEELAKDENPEKT